MKKRTKVAVWVAAGVLALGTVTVVAGPYAYASFAASTVSAPPRLTESAAGAGSPVDPASLSGQWKVGSGSFAGYRVNEVLEGKHVPVTGRTSKITGTLSVSDLTLTQATFSVEVGSISTPEPARDAYFRSTALQVAKFPTATFVLTAPVVASRPTVGRPESFSAVGELTLHGVTRTETVDLSAVATRTGGQVSGSIPITFSDFGVQAPSLGFVTVDKTGSVEFLLNLARN